MARSRNRHNKSETEKRNSGLEQGASQKKGDNPKNIHFDEKNEFFDNGIPIKFVQNAAELEKYVEKWKNLPEFAVDFEFDDNRRRYGRRMAIGQIFDGEEIVLIDFLQVKAIEPLLRLFEDENIKKVFHSCTSDLLLLDELYDCRSKNIEDTALMYKVAFDYGQDIGLKNLLAQTLGIEIEKEEQTSNWLERPLRNAQIFYAAKDVRYLFEMRKVLLTKMSDKQLRSYEAQRLKFNRLRYRKNHDWQNVFVKKHKLNRRNTFVAYKLLQLREEIAKRCDRPRFMVLSDDRLVQLLENLPQDLMQWKAFVSTHRLISENSTPEEFFESTKRFLLPESEWGILPEEFVMLIRKSQRPHNALLIAERDEYVRFLKEYSDQKKSEGEAVFSLAPPKMREIVIFGIYEVYKENQAKQIEEILEKEGRDPLMLSFSLYDGTYSEE